MKSASRSNHRVLKHFFVALLIINVFALCFYNFKYYAGSSPELEVLQPTHDFGEITGGIDVSHSFLVSNKGSKPLIISQISASCGCIRVAKMRNSTVPPGDKQELLVVMETPNYNKVIREVVSIKTNDSNNPIKKLYLQGNVAPRLTTQPSVINFGVVETSDLPVSQEVIIRNHSRDPGEKVTSVSKSNLVVVDVKKVQKEKWVLTATLPKGSALGSSVSDLSVDSTGARVRQIRILSQVVGDAYVEPNEVFYIATNANKKLQLLRVKSRKGRIVRVDLIIPPALRGVLVATPQSKVRGDKLNISINPLNLNSTNINDRLLLTGYYKNGQQVRLTVPVSILRRWVTR